MISDTIKYIGVDDLDIDLFESQYVVPEGMSYNSYLIDDEKIAVMDTADRRKGEEWKANLKVALNGRQPDYLVAHHMEPDHAALIAEMLETYPDLQLVCSAQAVKMLPNFFEGFNFEGRVITVKEGDTLQLGQHTLQFISAAMVHWPEVIMSYDTKDKVLFSADGFGKFGALVNETDDWACEARRYYFNICGKYGTQVQSVVKKMAATYERRVRLRQRLEKDPPRPVAQSDTEPRFQQDGQPPDGRQSPRSQLRHEMLSPRNLRRNHALRRIAPIYSRARGRERLEGRRKGRQPSRAKVRTFQIRVYAFHQGLSRSAFRQVRHELRDASAAFSRNGRHVLLRNRRAYASVARDALGSGADSVPRIGELYAFRASCGRLFRGVAPIRRSGSFDRLHRRTCRLAKPAQIERIFRQRTNGR